MMTYAKLQRKPKQFQAFTGVTPAQFAEIMQALRPVYAQFEKERLSRRRNDAGDASADGGVVGP